MTVTLARIEDANGQTIPGNKGISCFLLRVKQDDGSLNHIRIHKLKNKLGTKQLPTAELELLGSVAHRLSDPGRGIPLITTLVNITRLYNAVSSVGFMRRMLSLMRDYAHRRFVFSRTLSENPLHLETIAEVEIASRAAMAFTFDVAERLGRAEIPEATSVEDESMLRLLTPLVKLYTAKQAVAIASEGLESFGGQGYIEDSKLPRALRDAQVLPIWEGTTNVLSHDLLRVLATSKGAAFVTFRKVVLRRADEMEKALPSLSGELKDLQPRLTKVLEGWRAAQKELDSFVQSCLTGGSAGSLALESQARALAYATSRVYMSSCLSVHALFTHERSDFVTLERWVLEGEQRQSTAIAALVPHTIRQRQFTHPFSHTRILSLTFAHALARHRLPSLPYEHGVLTLRVFVRFVFESFLFSFFLFFFVLSREHFGSASGGDARIGTQHRSEDEASTRTWKRQCRWHTQSETLNKQTTANGRLLLFSLLLPSISSRCRRSSLFMRQT